MYQNSLRILSKHLDSKSNNTVVFLRGNIKFFPASKTCELHNKQLYVLHIFLK